MSCGNLETFQDYLFQVTVFLCNASSLYSEVRRFHLALHAGVHTVHISYLNIFARYINLAR
jgi:hypothetical protein